MLSDTLSRIRRSVVCRLARFAPAMVHRRASGIAARHGLDDLCMVVSFDCDTERDFEVMQELVDWLEERGVPGVLAVPGELLEKGSSVFRAVAPKVGEFINHGYRQHTVYADGDYEATLFYDRMSEQEVIDDILAGHDSLAEVLGITPTGFRAPHFGTVQDPRRRSLIRRVLADRGYDYSTSTMPEAMLLNGPLYRADGIVEFPITGTWNRPLVPLDSWGFRVAGTGYFRPEDFEVQFARVLEFYVHRGSPGLLNIYVDPSQVRDFPPFFDSIERARERGAVFTTYSSLVRRLEIL